MHQLNNVISGPESASSVPPWTHYTHVWASLLGCSPATGLSPAHDPAADESNEQSLQSSGLAARIQRQVFDALMAAVLGGMASLDLQYSSVIPESDDAQSLEVRSLM